jgi:hypothetical protein
LWPPVPADAGKRLEPVSIIFIAGKLEPHPVRILADTVAFAASNPLADAQTEKIL